MKMSEDEQQNDLIKQHINNIREKINQELIILDQLEASLGLKNETVLESRIRKYVESRKIVDK